MSADLNSLLAPNDDKQFEQLCQHVLEHRWKTLRGQAYGRPGQAQHGVDFYIEVPACGGESGPGAVQIIGVQCKHKDRLLEGELGVKELADEVKKAKEFTPALTTFIIATSAPTDTKPQDKARELTAEHQKQNPPLFSVEVWFWEKIRGEFCKDAGLKREILQRFYPNLIPAQSAQHSLLHQLPSKPAHFTGRDEELAELEKELASAHVVGATISGVRTKLHGAPGVGKTALATVLAHKLKDHYRDAQLYLNLRGAGADIHGQHSTAVKSMTPAEAMQSIIHAFHPEEKLPEELDKLSVKYNGVLNDAGRVLLFLDNAADAAQVQPLLPPDNCLLLVTSRAHFSLPGLAVRNIDCLRPEMSQKLLRDLSSRIAGCENEAAELCGHLPLALKIFAGVVNDKKLHPVPELIRGLGIGREKWDAIDAAFEISYQLLDERLRKRWRQLAVFDSFDFRAASGVWSIATIFDGQEKETTENSVIKSRLDDEARDDLEKFVNASLVEWDQPTDRFQLHDLARQFCNDKSFYADRIALAAAFSADLNPIRKRLEAILGIEDEAKFKSELRTMLDDFPALTREVLKSEHGGTSLYQISMRTFLNTLIAEPQAHIQRCIDNLEMAKTKGGNQGEGKALYYLAHAYAAVDDHTNAIKYAEAALPIVEVADATKLRAKLVLWHAAKP